MSTIILISIIYSKYNKIYQKNTEIANHILFQKNIQPKI